MSCQSYKLSIGLIGASQILEKGLTKSYEDDFVKVYSGGYTLAEALAYFRGLGYIIQHPPRTCDEFLAQRLASLGHLGLSHPVFYEECACYQNETSTILDYFIDYTLTVTDFTPLNGAETGCNSGLFDACYTLTTRTTITYPYGDIVYYDTTSLNADCQCCNINKTLNCGLPGYYSGGTYYGPYGISAYVNLDCTGNHNNFTNVKCRFCTQCDKYQGFLPCNHPNNCFEYELPDEITATVTFTDPVKEKIVCLSSVNCQPSARFQPTGASVWNGSYILTKSTGYNNTYTLGDLTVCRYPNPVPNYINLRLTNFFGLPLNLNSPDMGCIKCAGGFQLRVIFIHPALVALAAKLCNSLAFFGPVPLTGGALFNSGGEIGGIAPRPLYGSNVVENNLVPSNQYVLPGCTASLS